MKNNKLEEVSKGNPVALYIRYEEGNLNEMMKKVEILEKYCKEKNYSIIKKYFDISGYTCHYFTNNMRNILKNIEGCDYNKLIVCDINELDEYMNKVIAIHSIFEDYDIEIETINQGEFGKDFLLGGYYFENVLNKRELYEPRIVYEDNGEVVDRTERPISIID